MCNFVDVMYHQYSWNDYLLAGQDRPIFTRQMQLLLSDTNVLSNLQMTFCGFMLVISSFLETKPNDKQTTQIFMS